MAEIEPASDELLAEIERGLAGVTPGPWFECGPPWFHNTYGVMSGSPDPHVARFVADTDPPLSLEDEHDLDECEANAAHIARMSPDNIIAILARLRKAEDDNANMARLLSGYARICREAGIAPASSEIYAAAERATQGGENG